MVYGSPSKHPRLCNSYSCWFQWCSLNFKFTCLEYILHITQFLNKNQILFHLRAVLSHHNIIVLSCIDYIRLLIVVALYHFSFLLFFRCPLQNSLGYAFEGWRLFVIDVLVWLRMFLAAFPNRTLEKCTKFRRFSFKLITFKSCCDCWYSDLLRLLI